MGIKYTVHHIPHREYTLQQGVPPAAGRGGFPRPIRSSSGTEIRARSWRAAAKNHVKQENFHRTK